MTDSHLILLAFRHLCILTVPIYAFFGLMYIAESIGRNIRSGWLGLLLLLIAWLFYLGTPLVLHAESHTGCNARYTTTLANLTTAEQSILHTVPLPPDTVLDAFTVVHNQVSFRMLGRACSTSDLATLDAIDAALYRKGLALPPEQAEAKRQADAAAAQQKALQRFQDALQLLDK